MAQHSLSNSRSKLNLSNAKTLWIQKTIKIGSSMANFIRQHPDSPDGGAALAETWDKLLAELVEMMLF